MATAVTLNTKAYRYARATDAVSGEAVTVHAPIEIIAYHGRRLRCEK